MDAEPEIEPYHPPKRSLRDVRQTMMIWSCLGCAILAIGAGMFWVLTKEPTKLAPVVDTPRVVGTHTGMSVIKSNGRTTIDPQSAIHPPSPWRPDGAFFARATGDVNVAPSVHILPFPDLKGCDAIWGSVGRDARGHIWFGVSQRGDGSAVLVEYDPHNDRFTPRGDVVSAMEQAGLAKPGASQIKIHSRIVQARDGHLYFTSMDEIGEDARTATPPAWGSHLWRVRLSDMKWEHLATASDALIALSSGSGNRIYALGYWGHVLYQYDIATGDWRSIRVGSQGGHISRNVISDERDHVYVPNFTLVDGGRTGRASLVEYDAEFNEIAMTPLEHYGKDPNGHGIVGFQPMLDHSIIFITSEGYLYRIRPDLESKRAADVEPIGFMHPHGRKYIPSLFTPAGDRYVMGCSHTRGGMEWVVFDLDTGKSTANRLYFQYPDGRPISKHLLYGSITRDASGHFYLVGIDQQIYRPIVFRLSPP